jgi:hypothetical protein
MKTRIKFEWVGTHSGNLYFIVQAKHRLWFWTTIARGMSIENARELKKKLDELKEELL